jgi:hypothetical protein
MPTELQDADGVVLHDEFQAWRSRNPLGKFLTLETKVKAKLHGSGCHHLGNTSWPADPETGYGSLTRKRKVLGQGPGSLAAWAKERGVIVRLCQHCVRDGYVSATDLEPDAMSVSAVPASSVLKAIEGQLREVRSLLRSRSASLREAALAAPCGVCAACGIDFSRMLSGLGLRALQVHHKNQLSSQAEPAATKLDDLAVLCVNCHSMVHADAETPLPVEQLKAMLSRKPQ